MFRCDIFLPVACAGTLLQKHLCWTRLELEDCFHLSQLWAPRQELDGSSCCLWHQVHSPPAQERFPGRCFAWPDQCTEGKVYQGPKIKHVILSLDIVILFTLTYVWCSFPFSPKHSCGCVLMLFKILCTEWAFAFWLCDNGVSNICQRGFKPRGEDSPFVFNMALALPYMINFLVPSQVELTSP